MRVLGKEVIALLECVNVLAIAEQGKGFNGELSQKKNTYIFLARQLFR